MHPRLSFIPTSLAVLALGLSACDSSTASNDESGSSSTSNSSSTNSSGSNSVTTSLTGTSIDTNGLKGSTKDTATAHALTTTALTTTSDAFHVVFNGNANSSSQSPLGSQLTQLTAAHTTMAAAFAKDPNNSTANFGLAVTSLALRVQSLAGTFKNMQDSGLSIGNSTQPLLGSVSSIEASSSTLARAMATPAKAPAVHALQDTLETQLLPTLDSAIFLMNKVWNDTNFTLKIYDKDEDDSLAIDRSDIGYALAVSMALRASLSWIIAYDFDIADANGSYAWIDTLSHIKNIDPVLPTTQPQKAAWSHFKDILSASSDYLKVRSGKESMLSSVVPQFQQAVGLAKASTSLAYQIKASHSHLLIPQMTSTQKSSILRALDSANLWLAGPRTISLSWNTCQEVQKSTDSYGGDTSTYTDTFSYKRLVLFGLEDPCPSSYSSTGYYYSSSIQYTLTSSQSNSTQFSLPALLSLKNLKVFLPSSYAWNDTKDWDTYGPFFLKNGANTITVSALGDSLSAAHSYLPLKRWIQWSDPTFGGVFPNLKQGDIFDLLYKGSDIGKSTASSAARMTSALRLLP